VLVVIETISTLRSSEHADNRRPDPEQRQRQQGAAPRQDRESRPTIFHGRPACVPLAKMQDVVGGGGR
jgi:hypothetical protein